MILKDQKELSINLSCSVLYCSNISSIKTGIAAGVGTNLISAAERPNDLGALNYEIIASLRKAKFYLQRVVQ